MVELAFLHPSLGGLTSCPPLQMGRRHGRRRRRARYRHTSTHTYTHTHTDDGSIGKRGSRVAGLLARLHPFCHLQHRRHPPRRGPFLLPVPPTTARRRRRRRPYRYLADDTRRAKEYQIGSQPGSFGRRPFGPGGPSTMPSVSVGLHQTSVVTAIACVRPPRPIS